MGLDMYLYLSKYESVGRWVEDAENKAKNFYPEELKKFAEDIFEHNFMSKSTEYRIGYWRKANAIHKFFVDTCADGEDDCREIYVNTDVLEDLLNRCKTVLEDHSKARELLPTEDGFFFGSTDYDEWYFEDLEYTRDLIDKVLQFIEEQRKAKNCYEVFYKASW